LLAAIQRCWVFPVDVTILQDLIGLAFPLAVGLVSLIFYLQKKKSGMLVIAIAFFLSALMRILFGATMLQYFFSSGLGTYAYGLYVTIFGLGFQIAFTILMVIGLYMLYREMT
jgi:putative Mn2+ efflux pump MntP